MATTLVMIRHILGMLIVQVTNPISETKMTFDETDEVVAMEGLHMVDEARAMMIAEFDARTQKQIDSEILELEVKMMLELI